MSRILLLLLMLSSFDSGGAGLCAQDATASQALPSDERLLDDDQGDDEHGEGQHGEGQHGEGQHGEDQHGEDQHGEDGNSGDESSDPEFSSEANAFFENQIRPLLAARCFECHRGESIKGGLSLTSRAALLRGGESGPAIQPGNPEQSLLIQAVHYQTYEMPPDAKLSPREIESLEKWVSLGAPWPGGEASGLAEHAAFTITDEDRQWWAYRELTPTTPPLVQDVAATNGAIDRFIQAKIEALGLTAAQPVDARRWQRRLWFDLVGLPPEPQEVTRFLNEVRPDREAREVERLLASPSFGVRWGRHWLDVVRFAQTDGYERDGEKPEIWRYRDYVIDAFNEDLSFARFVQDQVAGDELPDADIDSAIATGFYRLGVWDDEPDDAVLAEYDERDDMLATIGTAFLGTTIGCARCHRHMFDPFSQEDYYHLLAFVHPIRRNERAVNRADSGNLIPLATPDEIAQWRSSQQTRLDDLERQLQQTAADQSEAQETLRKQIEAIRQEPYPFPVAMGIREGDIVETRVLLRGNPATPGEIVEPRFPLLFGGYEPTIEPIERGGVRSSGRRTALAQWLITDAQHVTSRVIVNRLWHYVMGRGLSPMTSDVGRAGIEPSHPDLIDWLASDLLDHEWSIKSTLKRIVLSETYGRDFQPASNEVERVDPANQWLSYRSVKRLDAEAIRDAMLVANESLNTMLGGRGFFPQLDGEVVAGGSRPGLGWSVSSASQQHRRSAYIFVKRSLRDPLIEAFDYGNTTSPLSERPVTTVAPQALMLLNSRWTHQQAERLVEVVESEIAESAADSIDDPLVARIEAMALRTLGRNLDPREQTLLVRYYREQLALAHERAQRIVIRPNAPKSLSVDYLRQLSADMLIEARHAEFSSQRGVWGQGYEGIETVDEHALPFVRWNASSFERGRWQMEIAFDPGVERASVLLSGTMDGEWFRGIECRFEPKAQHVSIWQHRGESRVLAESQWLPYSGLERQDGQWSVQIDVKGAASRLKIWAEDDAENVIELPFNAGAEVGEVGGLTAWGAPIAVWNLEWTAEGSTDVTAENSAGDDAREADVEQQVIRAATIPAGETHESWSQHLALVEVAKLMFNLNEFVYVD